MEFLEKSLFTFNLSKLKRSAISNKSYEFTSVSDNRIFLIAFISKMCLSESHLQHKNKIKRGENRMLKYMTDVRVNLPRIDQL